MEKINIIPWTSREDFDLMVDNILQLPYEDVVQLRSELPDYDERRPLALLAPYKPDDWRFTATCAARVRGAFPQYRTMVALPGANKKEVRKHLGIFTENGFDAFALPHLMAGVPVTHTAGFWKVSGFLRDDVWYHVVGGDGADTVAEVPGFWSWSEGEL